MIAEPTKRLTNHGRNIQRIRETLGVGQDKLAKALNISCSDLLEYEQQETIDESVLVKIASILHIPVELITNLRDDASMTFVSNTFSDMSMGIMGVYNTNKMENCTFNPLDKLISTLIEKDQLYERLLQSEKEKVVFLQDQLDKKR